MAELTIETQAEQGIAYLTLRGDFDADSAFAVQEAFTTLTVPDKPVIFVRMGELNYIDSAGLGVLVGALKQVSAQGGQIVLVSPSPFVSRVLRVTALDKVFTIAADEAQARLLLRPAPQ